MAINPNLILHLPFDDPDEAGKAYDYSQVRADAILSGGAFLTKDAKSGKALDLNVTGECETVTTIPFATDFTLMMQVKPVAGKIGWLLNMGGLENYVQRWVDAQADVWMSLAFVKSGTSFTAFRNGIEVQSLYLESTPIGFSVNDESVMGANSLIDEVIMFDSAKTQTEILKIINENRDVEYYVDGSNFKDYGVYVSGSTGIIGMLERKESLSVDWDSYHGVVVDTRRPRYKERTITLDCFIEASSKTSFMEWVQLFMAQFQKPGTQRLKVEYDGRVKPLYFQVFAQAGADVSKNWTYDNDLMVGTFKLTLIEPEPVKRVIRHIGATGTTAQVTVSSNKLLNIYWGDGTTTYDVSGVSRLVEHTYDEAGEYDIVITGVIEDISAFTTNCIIVWNKLL